MFNESTRGLGFGVWVLGFGVFSTWSVLTRHNLGFWIRKFIIARIALQTADIGERSLIRANATFSTL